MKAELNNAMPWGDSHNALSDGLAAEDQVDKTMPIAIVGLSCRYPGDAKNPESLWQTCAAKQKLWQPIPKERINQKAFYHPDSSRNGTVRLFVQDPETGSNCLLHSQMLEAVTFLASIQATSMHPSSI